MRIQSVSAYSFMNNSQNSSNAANVNGSTNAQNGTTKSTNSYYDILDISDIDLGDDNILDKQDIEAALQTDKLRLKRNMRLAFNSVSAPKQKFSHLGFDSPFLKNKPDAFMTQAAKIFAAYLNPEMSGGDDKVFAYAGNDFESAFNEFVKDQSKQYATQLAGFFSSNGEVNDAQVNKLAGEITQVIKEYGTQLAAGIDIDIENLTSKLSINGVEMSIGELKKTVATINDINPSKMILDSLADFAVAGLGVAKMNAFSYNSFSEPVADMIMKTYNNKVNEEITGNDQEIEQSKKISTKNDFLEKYLKGDSPELEIKKNNNNNSVDPYFKLDSKFKGSAKEEIFNMFSKINVTNIDISKLDYDKAVAEFEKIISQWESKRGYALSTKEVRSNELRVSSAYEALDNYIVPVQNSAK
jgi:hypothetical protein